MTYAKTKMFEEITKSVDKYLNTTDDFATVLDSLASVSVGSLLILKEHGNSLERCDLAFSYFLDILSYAWECKRKEFMDPKHETH
jgi:hypothetical protein